MESNNLNHYCNFSTAIKNILLTEVLNRRKKKLGEKCR